MFTVGSGRALPEASGRAQPDMGSRISLAMRGESWGRQRGRGEREKREELRMERHCGAKWLRWGQKLWEGKEGKPSPWAGEVQCMGGARNAEKSHRC